MSPHSRNLVCIHVAVLLFGFAGLFGDRRLLALPPAVIVFGRVVFASAALLIAGLFWRSILRPVSRRNLLAFAVLGVLLAVHWTAFFQAVKTSSVALALITFSTFPVFVAFLEPVFFDEKLRAVDIVRAALALAGVAILSPGFELNDPYTRGILWGIFAALTFALLSLLNRRLVRQHSGMTLTLYQDFFASVTLLPFVLSSSQSCTVRDLFLLIILGVLCTAVAHSLFIAGLHGISARTASTIACLEPVYGTFLAIVFFRDVPSPRTILGGLLILGVAFHATLKG